jgi:nitroimidazol reductase NimA-like FMN-containing flavoprotein (pyridoxamine 5'-phosphate oxidase superfamily)
MTPGRDMRAMRRSDREITDTDEIHEIIEKAQVCHIALSDGAVPYIVAMNFGFDRKERALYLHSATEGRKIGIIARNPSVCFMFDVDHRLVTGDGACDWGMSYRSVVGTGTAEVLTADEEKAHGLDIIMGHYGGKGPFVYPEEQLSAMAVIRIAVSELRGKKKEIQ